MANDNTIRTFTAQDIEKYHKGLLSATERHALEKAALDDPFLADALEGYAATGVNAQADIADLKNKLAERTTPARVVTLKNTSSSKTSFSWLRAAAMIILVAGAGLLVYQFAFNKAGKEIAQTPNNNAISTGILPDTAKTSIPADGSVDLKTGRIVVPDKEQAFTTKNKNLYKSDSSTSFLNTDVASPGSGAVSEPTDQKTDSLIAKRYVATATPVFENDQKKASAEKKEEYKSPAFDKTAADDKGREKASEGFVMLNEQQKKANNGIVANRKENNAYYRYSNTFRGRVTDASNNGLPFANVTNVQDNVGTYADARGYFNLTSTDSILNVQVKSNGFNSNNFQLRNNPGANQVVLQEDKSLAVQTLPPANLNYERHTRDGNMKLEEPEPEDGWKYYDSYLVNNLNIPDEAIRGKQAGDASVDVSFEVNKHGEPVNFKIEKSLCAKCDQEAIRLIKEGPKWKRKTKKGRTTVTISF